MLRLPKYKYYFAAADIFIITASFVTAFIINVNRMDFLQVKNSGTVLTLIFFFILLVFGFMSESQNLYTRNLILKRKAHAAAIGKVIVIITLIAAALSFFSFSFSHIRLGLFSTFAVMSFILFYVFRIELLGSLLNKIDRKNILIIGSGISGKEIASLIERKGDTGLNLSGTFSSINLNGNLKSFIENMNVDEILISPGFETYDEILEAVDNCRAENVTVKLVSDKFRIIPDRLDVERYFDFPVIDVTRKYKFKTLLFVKRVVDIIGSFIGLIALSPFFLIIALLIKQSSKGPIIFKQKRVGKNGKTFDFYKFRSMTVDKEDDEERKRMMLDFMKNNKAHKIINDKRVTSIGKILRRTSIDELPQLINVLKGDMSLVGPRPCLPYEYENYENWQRRRVKVLPGCTGVWQVSGRSSVNFNDSILLDLYYINNMSPLLDVKLIMKTLPVMILSKGGK